MDWVNRTLLLSYPRSGNTWLRYCVEVLTGKKTMSALRPPYDTLESLQRLPQMSNMDKNSLTPIDGDEIILEKSHKFFKNDEDLFNKLVLVVRDYKEAIPRHQPQLNQGSIDAYISPLISYDNFSGDKLVIYYEDLITKPKHTLKSLLTFLNEYDETLLDNFIQNYDKHKKNSLTIYDKYQGGNRGLYLKEGRVEDLNAHKKNLSKDNLSRLDNSINHKLVDRYRLK